MRLTLGLLVVLLLAPGANASGLCFVDSPNGVNVTVDCETPTPTLWNNSFRGYAHAGSPCESGSCGFDPNHRAGSNAYFWSISASDTDPTINAGLLPIGVSFLYLWLECANVDGMTAAEFSIVSDDPQLLYLGLFPRNGFLNAGDQFHILLAVGGCPIGPVAAAELLVINTGSVSVEPESWGHVKSLYR